MLPSSQLFLDFSRNAKKMQRRSCEIKSYFQDSVSFFQLFYCQIFIDQKAIKIIRHKTYSQYLLQIFSSLSPNPDFFPFYPNCLNFKIYAQQQKCTQSHIPLPYQIQFSNKARYNISIFKSFNNLTLSDMFECVT